MDSHNILSIKVEFSGGAELLFDGQRQMDINLPHQDHGWTIETLIQHLKQTHLKERPELFVQGKTVRPGILVLVNDTDWELLGQLEYQIQDKDNIMFISTLHGG